MKKIAIISDTHNVLSEKVISKIVGCDLIIHAGDITSSNILKKLETIATTISVKGNNDFQLDLPLSNVILVEDIKLYITHRYCDVPQNLKDITIVIFGHSHRYECYQKEGIQYLNPGGCGRRRFSLPLTMAYVYVDGSSFTIEKLEL